MLIHQNNILATQETLITIGLEPVYSILNSMGALMSIDSNPGLDEFIVRTAAQLTPESKREHQILFGAYGGTEALINLVEPGPATEDFRTYLQKLHNTPAQILRERIANVTFNPLGVRIFVDVGIDAKLDQRELANDRAAFIAYLKDEAEEQGIDDITPFIEAYDLLQRPDELKQRLLRLLQYLWDDFYAQEWQRQRPILEQSVQMLSGLSTTNLPLFDAIYQITGRRLNSLINESEVLKFKHIRLIPSRHNGPYITPFAREDTLFIVFGARLPDHMRRGDSPLDNAELLNRLHAMGDETRMDILIALHRNGEMSTGQIMESFNLNKSAASRHLRSLIASDLVSERRDIDGKGKYYELNREGIEGMLRTISQMFPAPGLNQ